jgi:hypothetical protein
VGVDTTVHLEGLRELQRAWKTYDVELAAELKTALREAAAPVAAEASRLAAANITNITPAWAMMKTGATVRGAYIAPAARRRSGVDRRPNFGRLLLGEAMLPAAESRRPEVERGIELMLDRLAARNGF